MKIKSLLFSLLILAASGYLLTIFLEKSETEENIDYLSTFTGKDIKDLQEDESLDSLQLALVDIHIVQGTEGKKSWELQADWGTYIQESTNIFTQNPLLTYTNSSENNEESQPIYVKGKEGRVLENNSLITLEKEVSISQDTLEITGPFLEFRVNEDQANLPQGSLLTSPTMLGKADVLSWDLAKNNLQAEKEVVLIINNDNKTYTLDYEIKQAPKF